MIKRCKFIVALALCLCVFAYDTVNISSDWGGRSIAWATDPTFSGNALVLSGQLGLYFYLKDLTTDYYGTMNFDIANTEADPSIDYKEGITITENSGEQIETQKAKGDQNQEIMIHGFRCDVNAIQMADEITATYTYNTNTTVENNGTDAIKSVSAYLTKLVATSPYSGYTNLKNLVNAIRDYGHYAQLTLKDTNSKYGTHTSMDKGSASELSTSVTEWTEEKNPKIKIYTDDAKTTVAGTEIYKSVSFTLDLDSKTALRVYLPKDSSLRKKNEETGDATVSDITVEAGSANNIANDNVYTVTDNVTATDSDSEFQIVFSNISAHQLGDIFTIPVTINSTSYTIVISPMSYVYAVTLLTYTENDTNLTKMGINTQEELTHFQQAVVALYNYYEKTLAYRKAPTATN